MTSDFLVVTMRIITNCEVHNMNDTVVDKILTYFWDKISDLSWEEWKETSSSDWEKIIVGTILEFGLFDYIDEVYDLFFEWSDGLTKESFDEFTVFS